MVAAQKANALEADLFFNQLQRLPDHEPALLLRVSVKLVLHDARQRQSAHPFEREHGQEAVESAFPPQPENHLVADLQSVGLEFVRTVVRGMGRDQGRGPVTIEPHGQDVVEPLLLVGGDVGTASKNAHR